MRNNIYPPSIHRHGMFIKTIWPGYHNHQIISGGESIIGRSNDAGGNIHVCSNWVFIGSVSPKLIILWGQLSINSNISSPHLSVLFSLYSHSIHSNLSRLESEKRKKDSPWSNWNAPNKSLLTCRVPDCPGEEIMNRPAVPLLSGPFLMTAVTWVTRKLDLDSSWTLGMMQTQSQGPWRTSEQSSRRHQVGGGKDRESWHPDRITWTKYFRDLNIYWILFEGILLGSWDKFNLKYFVQKFLALALEHQE